jgi:hypothetical protein
VLHTRLVCSDGDCAVLYEAYCLGPDADALACECGCGLQPLGWPQPVEGRAGIEVALLPLDR